VGECFFWYQLTRVVLDQRLLNGCVCVSVKFVFYQNYFIICICTYKSLSAAQLTYLPLVTSAVSTHSLDPFGQVARTCWRCLHYHPSLADILSATAHRLFGTSYRYLNSFNSFRSYLNTHLFAHH